MEVLRDAVLELRRQGSTVIFSTHDMDMAERMCDRVFMIYRGKKVLDGTLESIQSGYGANTLRVRMANHQSLPDRLEGVARQTIMGRFYDLELDREESRPRVLSQLLQLGDVEHFETTRPSLHDIFVKIARSSKSDRIPASQSLTSPSIMNKCWLLLIANMRQWWPRRPLCFHW